MHTHTPVPLLIHNTICSCPFCCPEPFFFGGAQLAEDAMADLVLCLCCADHETSCGVAYGSPCPRALRLDTRPDPPSSRQFVHHSDLSLSLSAYLSLSLSFPFILFVSPSLYCPISLFLSPPLSISLLFSISLIYSLSPSLLLSPSLSLSPQADL